MPSIINEEFAARWNGHIFSHKQRIWHKDAYERLSSVLNDMAAATGYRRDMLSNIRSRILNTENKNNVDGLSPLAKAWFEQTNEPRYALPAVWNDLRQGKGVIPPWFVLTVIHEWFGGPVEVSREPAKGPWRKEFKLSDIKDGEAKERLITFLRDLSNEGLPLRGGGGACRLPRRLFSEMLANNRVMPLQFLWLFATAHANVAIYTLAEELAQHEVMEFCRNNQLTIKAFGDFGQMDMYPSLGIVYISKVGSRTVRVECMAWLENGAVVSWDRVRFTEPYITMDDMTITREELSRTGFELQMKVGNQYLYNLANHLTDHITSLENSTRDAMAEQMMDIQRPQLTPEMVRAAAEMYTHVRQLRAVMATGHMPRAYGGSVATPNIKHLPTLIAGVHKLLPVVREQRGVYYNSLVKEVEKTVSLFDA